MLYKLHRPKEIAITMNILLVLFCFILGLTRTLAGTLDGTLKPKYSWQLRGMFDKEKDKLTHTYINMEYENIYSNIIQNAILGKTEIKFTILCWNEHDRHPIIKSVISDDIIRKIDIYQLSKENISIAILHKIKITFPDANITMETDSSINNYNKCIYYNIQW